MVLAESIVHLPVSARNRERIQARQKDEEFELTTGDSWLMVFDRDGRPLRLTLLYLKYLALCGYVHLDRIPRACIVRG